MVRTEGNLAAWPRVLLIRLSLVGRSSIHLTLVHGVNLLTVWHSTIILRELRQIVPLPLVDLRVANLASKIAPLIHRHSHRAALHARLVPSIVLWLADSCSL